MKIIFVFICVFCFRLVAAQDLVPAKQPHLIGYWKFQDKNNLIKATTGGNLSLSGTQTWLNGPAYKDTAVRIGIGSYYTFTHKIKPNGGGTRVNQYTLMYDFKVLNFNKWHTFHQTDSTNLNDGECFIRPKTGTTPGRIGVAATSYTADSVLPNKWYRLMISVNNGNFYRYYLNGKLILEGDTQNIDDRFSLGSQILFFADNNQEDDTIDVASLAMFDTCLSTTQIAQIGSIDPCIANPPKPKLGNDTGICSYNSLTRTPGSGYLKYQWSTGVKTATANLDLGKLKVGINTVWVKVTDYNNCEATDTVIITLVKPPQIQLGNDTAFCKGGSVILTANSDVSLAYVWKSLPKGNTISTNRIVNIDSSGIFSVTATSTLGCTGKDTIQIKVYNNPPKPTITAKGSLTICDGNTTELDGPSGYNQYLWNGMIDNAFIYVAKSDSITLKVKDLNGCTSKPSDTVIVKVSPNPKAPILNNKRDTNYCANDSIKLKAPSGFVEYIWQDGKGDSVRTIQNPGYYSVYIKDKNNCYSLVSNVVKVSKTNAPGKPITNPVSNLSICPMDSVMVSSVNVYDKYLWSNAETTKSIFIKFAGRVNLQVTNAQGCKSEWSDTLNINFLVVPNKPKISIYGGGEMGCDIKGGALYEWYQLKKLVSTDSIISNPIGINYYTVRVKNKFCFSAFSDSFLYLYEGVKQPIFGKIEIFPNPTAGMVFLQLPSTNKTPKYTGSILDIQGKTVKEFSIYVLPGVDNYPVDLNSFSKGIYFIKLRSYSSVYWGKCMKE